MPFSFETLADFYWKSALHVVLLGLMVAALELRFPAHRYSLWSRLRGTMNFLVYLGFATLVWALSLVAYQGLGLRPLISIDLAKIQMSMGPVAQGCTAVLAGVVLAVIQDFFRYWYHRLQHTVPLFWRFHSVHHSIREMSALNSNHHFGEDLLALPFVALPLMLIQIESSVVPTVVALLIGALTVFQHSDIRLHLGPLGYVIADQRFHRMHHSIEPRYWGTNFSNFLTVWDVVFRTARFPRDGERFEVGLADQPEPSSVSEFVLQPFLAVGRSGLRP